MRGRVVSALGDFLRSRRDQVDAGQVGLAATGVRRVPGLRREEVAALAAVSVDYYIRLERGRETSPSAPVLDALASALCLDSDARLHLFRLAGLAPRTVHAADSEYVDPRLLRMMDGWPDLPAVVYNRAGDILAANSLAEALFDGLVSRDNIMLRLFRNPEFYAEWSAIAAQTVAYWRVFCGPEPYEGRAQAVLAELLDTSAEFKALWVRNEAHGATLQDITFRHHAVGDLTLTRQIFGTRFAPGLELLVYQAAPGGRTAAALTELATLQCAPSPARGASPNGRV
jgi:transcriptional regulator with XRE-family HTH domain